MREHAASSPERKAELAALLRSGAVTQAAINHAGHCHGGARGVAAYPPFLPFRRTLSCTLSPPPSAALRPPLSRHLLPLSSTPLSQRLTSDAPLSRHRRVRRHALAPGHARRDRGGDARQPQRVR